MIPRGVTLGPGRRIPVSQRGYFTVDPATGQRHYTACMFAGEAQLLERRGYRLPLGRAKPAPGQPDNFVHSLQVAGDPTPQNGSTIRQGQAALQKLFGADLPEVKYGALTDDELIAELGKASSIRVSVDCSKLTRALKRWVGYGYTGRHAITFDAVSLAGGRYIVARTDPMYRPARAIQAESIYYDEIKPALVRTAAGKVIVTITYQGDMTPTTSQPEPAPEPAPTPPAETDAQRADRLEAELETEHELRLAQAERSQQLVADVEGAIARYEAPMEPGS